MKASHKLTFLQLNKNLVLLHNHLPCLSWGFRFTNLLKFICEWFTIPNPHSVKSTIATNFASSWKIVKGQTWFSFLVFLYWVSTLGQVQFSRYEACFLYWLKCILQNKIPHRKLLLNLDTWLNDCSWSFAFHHIGDFVSSFSREAMLDAGLPWQTTIQHTISMYHTLKRMLCISFNFPEVMLLPYQ